MAWLAGGGGAAAGETAGATAAEETAMSVAAEQAAQKAAEEQMASMAVENQMLTQGQQLGAAQGGGGAMAGGVVGKGSAATGSGGAFSNFIKNNVQNAKFKAGEQGYQPSGMSGLFDTMNLQALQANPTVSPEQIQQSIWQQLLQRMM